MELESGENEFNERYGTDTVHYAAVWAALNLKKEEIRAADEIIKQYHSTKVIDGYLPLTWLEKTAENDRLVHRLIFEEVLKACSGFESYENLYKQRPQGLSCTLFKLDPAVLHDLESRDVREELLRKGKWIPESEPAYAN